MSDAVNLVRRHLKAVWGFDWPEVARTVGPDPNLEISREDWTHSEWEVGNFYRHLSEAWDFFPGDVLLRDGENGIVLARLRLTNGGQWAKNLDGAYHVKDGRIASIRFVDTAAFQTPE